MTRSSAGLSKTVDEGDAHRQRRVDARRQLLALEQVFHQFFGSIGPHDLFGNADEIAQHPGPLEGLGFLDWAARL